MGAGHRTRPCGHPAMGRGLVSQPADDMRRIRRELGAMNMQVAGCRLTAPVAHCVRAGGHAVQHRGQLHRAAAGAEAGLPAAGARRARLHRRAPGPHPPRGERRVRGRHAARPRRAEGAPPDSPSPHVPMCFTCLISCIWLPVWGGWQPPLCAGAPGVAEGLRAPRVARVN